MRKRTNWSSGFEDEGSRTTEDRNELSGFTMNNNDQAGWSGFQDYNTSSEQAFQRDSFIQDSATMGGSRGRYRRRPDSASVIRIAGIIATAALILLLIVVMVQYGPALLKNLAEGVNRLITALIYSLVIALVIWGILMAIIGRLLPYKIKSISFIVIFVVAFLGKLAPSVGYGLGVLVCLVAGIVILIYVMVR